MLAVVCDLKRAMGLVKKLRTYAYDAYMLVCAQQTGTPLLTLDDALKVHAESLGIDTLEVWKMKVYTFSEARQNFATLLDEAQKEGAVGVTRRDGRALHDSTREGCLIATRGKVCAFESEA